MHIRQGKGMSALLPIYGAFSLGITSTPLLLYRGSVQLHLYRFKLSESQEDDLERLRNNNKYKLTTTYQSGTQSINGLSCINSFLSPLVLVAGSNRQDKTQTRLRTVTCITFLLAPLFVDAGT